jgi:hypothetical protein
MLIGFLATENINARLEYFEIKKRIKSLGWKYTFRACNFQTFLAELMPRDPPRNIRGEFILCQDESSITCKRTAQYSLFVCGLWLCLLFWPGLFNDMIIWLLLTEHFLKRQCCVRLLLILIACWSRSTIIPSVAKTQTLQAHLLVHRVANVSEANLRCESRAVNCFAISN